MMKQYKYDCQYSQYFKMDLPVRTYFLSHNYVLLLFVDVYSFGAYLIINTWNFQAGAYKFMRESIKTAKAGLQNQLFYAEFKNNMFIAQALENC